MVRYESEAINRSLELILCESEFFDDIQSHDSHPFHINGQNAKAG